MHTLEALKAGHLSHLTRLKIAENLEEFPSEIFSLAETLEILDLSDNRLDHLPKDFGRLHRLKVVFLSNNQFTTLPSVLADCANLRMIGFKANQISHIPENALPKSTRWLILTDNQIKSLPDSIGELKDLQKFMLAGNQLTTLPASMANCRKLELFRVSANHLSDIPSWLLQLPVLSWLAFAGNPATSDPMVENLELPILNDDDLNIHELLGAGASGHIHRATLEGSSLPSCRETSDVAIKIFKGEVTSDGFPEDELHASLNIGTHPNLVQIIAQYANDHQQGLIMELIPKAFTNLGYPPNFETCTRDTFSEDFSLDTQAVIDITQQVAGVLQHLHSRRLNHGDLYAHNLLINSENEILLSDYGAASRYGMYTSEERGAIERIEVRAFGCLMEDLLTHCSSDQSESEKLVFLRALQHECTQRDISRRPSFSDIYSQLTSFDESNQRQRPQSISLAVPSRMI